jgi:hypothetical protein
MIMQEIWLRFRRPLVIAAIVLAIAAFLRFVYSGQ